MHNAVNLMPSFDVYFKWRGGVFSCCYSFEQYKLIYNSTSFFQQLIEEWHKIFFICITVVLSSGISFAIFGSAEIQPWNNVPEINSLEMNHKNESWYQWWTKIFGGDIQVTLNNWINFGWWQTVNKKNHRNNSLPNKSKKTIRYSQTYIWN